ncbi:MAG TPA: hypothetical protein VF173_15330 [Thermoanaerobaculia bacterium]|nr:hypothetical protein [Thermoanaerobaculia bacterium]
MSHEETARKSYEFARQEYIQRIQLREYILLAFLGAVATIFGIALGTQAKPEILLIVPYLALGATVLTIHHHGAIRAIAQFLDYELGPFLSSIGADAPQWDNSKAIKEFLPKANRLRTLGYFLLIIVPALASLLIMWSYRLHAVLWLKLLWWFGVLTSLLSTALVIVNHVGLKRLNQVSFSVDSKDAQVSPGA